MSWTKSNLIKEAYGEIGLASYVYDLQPEQLESALRRMDSMMANWYSKGISVGYPLPSTPTDSSLDEASNIPDIYAMAIYTNLAIQIAPGMGKTPSPQTVKLANSSYRDAMIRSVTPKPVRYPAGMPVGAGNKPRAGTHVFSGEPELGLDTGNGTELDL
tara:strand:- start:15523 stop:15999 length:477 start_codon:yes stop_codon:yes gene_type:complete